MNCGKKSIVLDLQTEDGKRLATELAAQADVVVENFRPGVMKRLGLDYATLSRDNPRLVYASISGFGQTGPMASAPAYAPVIHAASGYELAYNQYQRGGDRPANNGIFIADVMGASLRLRRDPARPLRAREERPRPAHRRLADGLGARHADLRDAGGAVPARAAAPGLRAGARQRRLRDGRGGDAEEPRGAVRDHRLSRRQDRPALRHHGDQGGELAGAAGADRALDLAAHRRRVRAGLHEGRRAVLALSQRRRGDGRSAVRRARPLRRDRRGRRRLQGGERALPDVGDADGGAADRRRPRRAHRGGAARRPRPRRRRRWPPCAPRARSAGRAHERAARRSTPRRCRAPRSARCCATRCAAFSPSTGRRTTAVARGRDPDAIAARLVAAGRARRRRPRQRAVGRRPARARGRDGGARPRRLPGAAARRRPRPTWRSPGATRRARRRTLLAALHAGSAARLLELRRARPERRRERSSPGAATGSRGRCASSTRAAAATHLVVARRRRHGRDWRSSASAAHDGGRVIATRALGADGWAEILLADAPAALRAAATTRPSPTCSASPASPCSPAPTARPAAPSRWRSTTPRSAGSSASRSAASRRSSTSSPTT